MLPDLDTVRDRIITLDFETYYDAEYSLTGRMNMSEYVRDERFKVHGVGIQIGSGEPRWYSGADAGTAILAIDWSDKYLLCHHTAFDGFILSHHFGVKPFFYLDTKSMARGAFRTESSSLDHMSRLLGLGEKIKRVLESTKGILDLPQETLDKLGEYCCMDTGLTYKLFWKLYPYIPDTELRLIDLTIRMYCDPVLLLDKERVQALIASELAGRAAALFKSGVTAEQLISNQQFAALMLERTGVSVSLKVSKTTGQPTLSLAKTDPGFKRLLTHSNVKVRDLAEARLKLKSNIDQTRGLRLLEAGRDGMALPVLLNYCGAHTTRWSGGDKMNFQNFKRRGELRKSIRAPKGFVIGVADSAQIEARTNAYLADQVDLLQAFREGRDVYSEFAENVYLREIKKGRDDLERFVGKTCILGLGYGMGPVRLRETLALGTSGPVVLVNDDEALRLVKIYRGKNRAITKLWDTMSEMIGLMYRGGNVQFKCLTFLKGSVRLPSGLFLEYPDLQFGEDSRTTTYWNGRNRVKIYGGLLTENVCQAVARCVVAEQKLKISERYRVVMSTHDEVAALIPEHEAEEGLDFMLSTMRTSPTWAPDLPLAAEGGYDDIYSK